MLEAKKVTKTDLRLILWDLIHLSGSDNTKSMVQRIQPFTHLFNSNREQPVLLLTVS